MGAKMCRSRQTATLVGEGEKGHLSPWLQDPGPGPGKGWKSTKVVCQRQWGLLILPSAREGPTQARSKEGPEEP